MPTAQTRGRLTLLTIAFIFALPIALAAYFYFSDSGWRPGETTHLGDLINPPRELPDTLLTAGESSAQLRDIWTLLVPAGNSCDEVCLDALVKIRQTRQWMGNKLDRMQTVFLAAAPALLNAQILSEHPALIVADPTLTGDIRTAVGQYNNGQIFVVDPWGNLMMSYPPGVDMGDIRKDLGHLLIISNIG